MRRAVKATVMLGFISAILLLLYAVNYTDYLLLFVGIMSLIATINDRMSLAQGSDPVFLVDPNYVGVALSSGWRQRWAARSAAVTEREAAAEQEVLDRLLAKVSEHGLPSLTKTERTQLQKISRRQKDRAQAP